MGLANVSYVWVIEIILGVLGLFLVQTVFKRFIKKMEKGSLADAHHHLGLILFSPVKVIVFVLGIYYVINLLGTRFGFSSFSDALKPFRDSCVVLCFAWMAMKWKKEFIRVNQIRFHWPSLALHGVDKLFSILVGLLATLLILQIFQLDILPLLAFGGIGAAALGFAAKDVMGNFFGGIMLSITRPFAPRDTIILTNPSIEGVVEEVGWCLTAIRDKDKRPVYLPNSLFSNVIVINSTRMTHRRIYETLTVRYDDFHKLQNLMQKMKEYVIQHPCVDKAIPVLIHFYNFSAYSLDIYLDIYTTTTVLEEYLVVREELLANIYKIFLEKNVQMPFPVTTVQLLDSR